MPLVTKKHIELAKTKNGGWTKKQLEILGISWPPYKGWKNDVIKNHIIISNELLNKFISYGKGK